MIENCLGQLNSRGTVPLSRSDHLISTEPRVSTVALCLVDRMIILCYCFTSLYNSQYCSLGWSDSALFRDLQNRTHCHTDQVHYQELNSKNRQDWPQMPESFHFQKITGTLFFYFFCKYLPFTVVPRTIAQNLNL